MKPIRHAVVILLVALLLPACGPGKLFGPTITSMPTETASPSPTLTPTFTAVRTPTSSVTPAPQLVPITLANLDDITLLYQPPIGRKARSVAFSPDGSTLAIGTEDGILLYSLDQSSEESFIDTNLPVYSLSFSPDGSLLAAGVDKFMRLYTLPAGQMTYSYGFSGQVRSVSFSSDGTLIVAGSFDKTVALWSSSDHHLVSTFRDAADWILATALSPDNSILAAAVGDGTIILWDTRIGGVRQTLRANDSVVNTIMFSSDGAMLFSGGGDGLIEQWNVGTGELTNTIEGRSGNIMAMAPVDGGAGLAWGGMDGRIRIMDDQDPGVFRECEGHLGMVEDLASSPDGNIVVSVGSDYSVRAWDALTCALVAEPMSGRTRFGLIPPRGIDIWNGYPAVSDPVFLTEGSQYLFSTSSVSSYGPDILFIADPITGMMEPASRQFSLGNFYGAYHLAYSPNENTVAISGDDGVYLCDLENDTVTPVGESAGHGGAVAISQGGGLVAWGGVNGIGVLNRAANNAVEFANPGNSNILDMEFSPDEEYLAVAVMNGLDLFATTNGEHLGRIGDREFASEVHFTHDGEKLVVVRLRRTEIEVWEMPSEQRLFTFYRAQSIAISPTDESFAVVVDNQGGLRIDDFVTGETLRTLDVQGTKFVKVFFDPTGLYFLALTVDGRYVTWGIQR